MTAAVDAIALNEALRRACQRLSSAEEVVLQEAGLTWHHHAALRVLMDCYPNALTVMEVARRVSSLHINITPMLDFLATQGLIDRKRLEQNRRKVMVTITQSGLDLLESISPRIRKWLEEAIAFLSDEEQRDLLRLASKFNDHPVNAV